jgi:PAS domain-containing protein
VTDLSSRMLYASSTLEHETGFAMADFQFPQADNSFIHRDDAERVGRFIADFLVGDAGTSGSLDNRFYDRRGRSHTCRSVISKVRYAGVPALQFACRTVGAPASTTEDVALGDLLRGGAPDAFRAHVAREADAAASPLQFDVELVAKGGGTVFAQVSVSSLARFGAPDEWLAILRDVTTEHRAAAERDALELKSARLQQHPHGRQRQRRVRARASCERSKNTVFRVTLGAAPMVNGDTVQRQQVVMKLLVNASEALGTSDGSVTVETGACRLHGDAATFPRVVGDGSGMDEATMGRGDLTAAFEKLAAGWARAAAVVPSAQAKL